MTYISQIRGLSISDALAQVQFSEKKVAKFIQTVCPVCPTCKMSVTTHPPPLHPFSQTLLDTQRRAFEIHSVEPTNLHVGKKRHTLLPRTTYHCALPPSCLQWSPSLARGPTCRGSVTTAKGCRPWCTSTTRTTSWSWGRGRPLPRRRGRKRTTRASRPGSSSWRVPGAFQIHCSS